MSWILPDEITLGPEFWVQIGCDDLQPLGYGVKNKLIPVVPNFNRDSRTDHCEPFYAKSKLVSNECSNSDNFQNIMTLEHTDNLSNDYFKCFDNEFKIDVSIDPTVGNGINSNLIVFILRVCRSLLRLASSMTSIVKEALVPSTLPLYTRIRPNSWIEVNTFLCSVFMLFHIYTVSFLIQ